MNKLTKKQRRDKKKALFKKVQNIVRNNYSALTRMRIGALTIKRVERIKKKRIRQARRGVLITDGK